MKKVVVILAVALFFASNATAGSLTASQAPGFNPTKNVRNDYASSATVSGGPVNVFALSANHQSGDREFATTSAFGGIAFKTINPGAAPTAPSTPGSPTDSAVPSGYTNM